MNQQKEYLRVIGLRWKRNLRLHLVLKIYFLFKLFQLMMVEFGYTLMDLQDVVLEN